MKNTECSTGQGKNCFVMMSLSALAVFVVMFVAEMIFHRGIMVEYYKATANMWRPEPDMMNHLGFSILRQIVTAMIFTCVYCSVKKGACETDCPIKVGVKVGLKLGLLIGITLFGSYVWLPFADMTIPLMWLVGYTVIGILAGVTLGVICKMSKGKCDKTGSAS